MGFPPAEVAAGVRELLAARRLEAVEAAAEGGWVFRVGAVAVHVGPLPPGRPTSGLFHPRTLLVVSGEGPLAEQVKAGIRLKFLRVTG